MQVQLSWLQSELWLVGRFMISTSFLVGKEHDWLSVSRGWVATQTPNEVLLIWQETANFCNHPWPFVIPDHIVLQPSCQKVVDKYIEFDHMVIFLDALLHKPQVYRHLLFNIHISVSTAPDSIADSLACLESLPCLWSTCFVCFWEPMTVLQGGFSLL